MAQLRRLHFRTHQVRKHQLDMKRERVLHRKCQLQPLYNGIYVETLVVHHLPFRGQVLSEAPNPLTACSDNATDSGQFR